MPRKDPHLEKVKQDNREDHRRWEAKEKKDFPETHKKKRAAVNKVIQLFFCPSFHTVYIKCCKINCNFYEMFMYFFVFFGRNMS